MRTMTLRLDETTADEVDVARRVLETSAVELIRVAIARYLDELRDDPDFQRQLAARLTSNARALEHARGVGREPADAASADVRAPE